MLKLVGIAIAAFLLIIGSTFFNGTSVIAQNYGNRLFQSHQDDLPIASPAIAQAPTQSVQAQRVNYGTINGKPISGYLARPENTTKPREHPNCTKFLGGPHPYKCRFLVKAIRTSSKR
jgi:carboxymethylenebutenolidase